MLFSIRKYLKRIESLEKIIDEQHTTIERQKQKIFENGKLLTGLQEEIDNIQKQIRYPIFTCSNNTRAN